MPSLHAPQAFHDDELHTKLTQQLLEAFERARALSRETYVSTKISEDAQIQTAALQAMGTIAIALCELNDRTPHKSHQM